MMATVSVFDDHHIVVWVYLDADMVSPILGTVVRLAINKSAVTRFTADQLTEALLDLEVTFTLVQKSWDRWKYIAARDTVDGLEHLALAVSRRDPTEGMVFHGCRGECGGAQKAWYDD